MENQQGNDNWESRINQVFDENNSVPESNGKSPLDEVFNPSPEPVLFDKNANQRMVITQEDDDARYELGFVLAGLSDEDLAEFDHLSFVKIESQGDNQIFRSDDLDACSWFFEKNVDLVSGFEGELPSSWRDSFGLLERQKIVREFMGAYVQGAEKTKFKKNRTFGVAAAKKIVISATFDGEEIDCVHTLPADDKKHLRKFIEITQGFTSKKGKAGTFLPETFSRLGKLYDEMNIAAENYAPDGIPLHHKALVLREVFQAQADTQRKK